MKWKISDFQRSTCTVARDRPFQVPLMARVSLSPSFSFLPWLLGAASLHNRTVFLLCQNRDVFLVFDVPAQQVLN